MYSQVMIYDLVSSFYWLLLQFYGRKKAQNALKLGVSGNIFWWTNSVLDSWIQAGFSTLFLNLGSHFPYFLVGHKSRLESGPPGWLGLHICTSGYSISLT